MGCRTAIDKVNFLNILNQRSTEQSFNIFDEITIWVYPEASVLCSIETLSQSDRQQISILSIACSSPSIDGSMIICCLSKKRRQNLNPNRDSNTDFGTVAPIVAIELNKWNLISVFSTWK